MNPQRQHRPAQNDPAGLRECRVTALKGLIEKAVYEIPSEDVAASIMRDAIVIGAPSPPTQPQPEPDHTPRPER